MFFTSWNATIHSYYLCFRLTSAESFHLLHFLYYYCTQYPVLCVQHLRQLMGYVNSNRYINSDIDMYRYKIDPSCLHFEYLVTQYLCQTSKVNTVIHISKGQRYSLFARFKTKRSGVWQNQRIVWEQLANGQKACIYVNIFDKKVLIERWPNCHMIYGIAPNYMLWYKDGRNCHIIYDIA